LPHLPRSLSFHPFPCPICPTPFHFTISLVPYSPLPFNSPFLLSHLPHSLSFHHFPCPICPTPFQFTISLVPSAPLPFISPFPLSHLSHTLSVHHLPFPICPTPFQFTISLVPSVPLPFSSPFPLSHLSHSLSVHHFPCPICPTVFHFTTHQHSVASTSHAASHCAILFIFLLLPLSSYKISPSASVLAQYFRVQSLEHKHTPSNTLNSVYPKRFIHNPDLLCEICVISLN
jgi:hypothetical protein